ncbi:glycoside hydrolase family 3 protein [Aquimarina pacifica]|uniref:glycoside hydrolase family 3 protein n=1 Tax=Aquimarina pacifica TaxID=1296415 RepID=UPI001F4CC107|nr:glycoside hydrolase family 3 N-terminal domain-containing protein [Aquimarina pacifica]
MMGQNSHSNTMNLLDLSKTEKIGQFFSPAAFINDSDTEIKKLELLIKNHSIGGLTFFHSRASTATNFEGKKKIEHNKHSAKRLSELIRHYQDIAPTPLLISIDAEWGLAMRVENTPQYPYPITLGAVPETESQLIFEVGKQTGNDLATIGIHLNLAPVADINTNPNNPVIGYRSFGEDKEHITQKSLTYYKGLKASGILGCFKHFPGHGDTEVDSHLGLPVLTKSKQELLDQELYPFRKAIVEGIDSILIGHLAVPALTKGKHISATLSREVIKDLLRNELGFDGVVISDALNMHSVSKLYPKKGELEWRAFDAGNDILCFAEHVEEGIAMIEKNATDHQIEESLLRIQHLKQNIVTNTQPSTTPTYTFDKTTSLNQNIAKGALTHYKLNLEGFKKFMREPFEAIMIGNAETCIFLEEIKKNKQFLTIPYDQSASSIPHTNNVLIALFPPEIKPINQFGITSSIKNILSEIGKTKNVLLYVFGNPYSIRVFETKNIDNIVLGYQDFETFQNVAAQHFLGQHQAVGMTPVHLSTQI